ncbi:siderophore ABC transporter substrate-binding protein [uncultured Tyzzerella sp.]|uniref:siderophore ABC transporter substrate-binding protein n=1 Tax=uncultured Tyzzerella sp. TaxID=2321398 RepID=UPI0029432FEE|nr:siderophore ABC transporter substrate-binding protein [uncultured Tyzzerella sp.]
MKKLLKLSFTLLMASSLFACGATEKTATNTSKEDSQATEQEITISHSKGESTVKLNPKKVAVFDMGTLDTIDKLGIDAEFALPLKSIPSYITGYENSTNAGGIKEPDLEAIYTFAPDVIFISGRQEDFYEELNKIAPTIYVGIDYKNYMQDFKTNVTNIGKIFNKEDLALEEYNKLEDKINEAKEKVKDIEEKALIILTSGGKVKAYGSGSRFGFIHDIIGYKHADENMYKDGEEPTSHGKEVSFEYISEINPDILFVLDRDAVVGEDGDAKSTLNNDLVNNTNAVKNNKVVMIDPESWYISDGGLSAVNTMIEDTISLLK